MLGGSIGEGGAPPPDHEALARWVADRLAERFAGDPLLTALVVTLHESHVAWGSYERPLGSDRA